MKAYTSIVLLVMTNIYLVFCQTATKCQSSFLTSLYGCMQNEGINPTHLFWMTRNGTMGNKPENITSFKIEACKVELNLHNCSNTYVKKLETDESCPEAERDAIKQFFYSMFISYDDQCAHPCRETLIEDLKKCYGNAGVDPSLFISNATVERGSIIGSTDMQVQQFCGKRQELVGCLKAERDICPEAPTLLSKMGLDIESLSKTVDVLCAHPKLYLNSLDCFTHPESRIEVCRNIQTTDLLKLNIKAKDQAMKFNPYMEEYCRIRIDHVSCDLRGWAAAKRDSCANNTVMGLRTELECSLLPDYCVENYSREVGVMCSVDKFKRPQRDPNHTTDDHDDDDHNDATSIRFPVYILLLFIFIRAL